MPKRSKLSHPSMQITRCQVEGCNLDLTSAKDYHRRHKICESHSKSPQVIVAGFERRFCQQCSRFHNLSEFDDKKRSCRRRLSDHNARRRRPHPGAIPFSSTGFSSYIYDGRPQNVLLNKMPASASHRPGESFCTLKMAQAGNSLVSPSAHIDRKQYLPLQHLNSGKDTSSATTGLDEALAGPRALSLLSTSSWGLNEPEPCSLEQIMQGNISTAHSFMQLESQNWPVVSSEHVSKEQAPSSALPMLAMEFHSTADSSRFQDFLSFKMPYEPSFYYSSRIN